MGKKTELFAPILLVGVSALLLSGCPSQDAEQEETDTEAHIETYAAPVRSSFQYNAIESHSQQFKQQHHEYAAGQLRHQPEGKDNYHTAPFDQQQFIAMVSLGAATDTLEALGDSVGLTSPSSETHQTISAIQQQLNSLSSMTIRTGLWGQQNYPFSVDYLRQQSLYYAPELFGVDFVNDPMQADDEIRYWLGNPLGAYTTDGRSRLVAAQQSKINAAWSAELTTTQVEGRFAILEEDEQRWVTMVKIDGNMDTTEQADYTAVKIPLSDPTLSLQIITPELEKFESVKNSMDSNFIAALQQQYQLQTRTLMLPHFTLSQSDWPEGAIDIGIAAMEEQADLSAVNNYGELYLLTPQRKIDFKLDNNGIESNTLLSIVHQAMEDEQWTLPPSTLPPTWSGVITTSPANRQPCYYSPDQRPFLFILYEQQSETVLQIGQVTTLYGESVSPDWYVRLWQACGTGPATMD